MSSLNEQSLLALSGGTVRTERERERERERGEREREREREITKT